MARQNVYAYRPHSSEQVNASTTPAQSGTTPFGCNVARVTAHGTSGAPLTFFLPGKNPTSAADGSSIYIHENDQMYITVIPDSSPGAGDGDRFSVVTDSGSSKLFITWLEG